MKNIYHQLFFLLMACSFFVCSNPASSSKHDAPSSHTVSKNGAMHKSGYKTDTTSCVECHGNDLKGGTSGVSCYECHGKKW